MLEMVVGLARSACQQGTRRMPEVTETPDVLGAMPLQERVPAPVAKNVTLLEPGPKVEKPAVVLANTQETTEELKRRLGKELYRLELDLQNGGRIAGKVCDCLSKKHAFGLEATSEELMSYDTRPVYGQVISWIKKREPVFQPEEIAKHEPDYYRAMIPEVRALRKEVMGTEHVAALLNPEEKQAVLAKALK